MENFDANGIYRFYHVKRKGCSEIKENLIGFYDLTFVLEGCLVYIIDKKRYVLQSDDAIFLPPKSLRARESGDSYVNYVSLNFQFSTESPPPFDIFLPKCLTVNVKRLLSLYQETHLSDLPNSRAKCVCLLNYILYELSDAIETNSRNPHVSKMLEYIKKHKTDKITLKDISAYTNLSKEYCSHLFKEETAKTLIHYINEQKISVAKALIANNEMSLVDICYYLGYDNYNYFSRLFKKHVGVPPTEFSSEWK